MPRKTSNTRSRGQDIVDRLTQAQRQAQRAPRPGAADIALIHGVGPSGIYTLPAANVQQDIQAALLATRRIYAFGDSLVWDETQEQGNSRLIPIADGYSLSSAAKAIIGRQIMCEAPSLADTGPIQFPLHASVLGTALASLRTSPELPVVKVLAKRPVYDNDFVLCGGGWHEESQTLVHAGELEPNVPGAMPNLNTPSIERLMPALQRLFDRFCFQGSADVANTLACALTALLVPRFVDVGKPLVLIDGNQPGLGKTLLAGVLGVIWDGQQPRPIAYTPDNEELGKRLCAGLRADGTVLVIDNARRDGGKPIESTSLESQCLSPVISLRLLGQSRNFSRPNDVLWIVTMNNTCGNEDLLSRSIPIRLYWEGATSDRDLADEDPISYARDHRYEILAELTGMIEYWKQCGQPLSSQKHRCKEWARIVGGILEANGFPEFLENLATANSDFSESADQLSRLAEAVMVMLRSSSSPLAVQSPAFATASPINSHPWPAARWIDLFRHTGVCAERLQLNASHRGMATIVGRVLASNKNRSVTAVVDGRTWQATLRVRSAAGNAKEYYFEFSPTAEEAAQCSRPLG